MPPNLRRKEEIKSVMKIFKQLLFTSLMTAAFSLTAMAQNQDDKKPPKKPDPPVIVVPDKDKPKDRPKDDKDKDRPKKPSDVLYISSNQTEISFG